MTGGPPCTTGPEADRHIDQQRSRHSEAALLDALFDELEGGASQTVDHYVNLVALTTPLKPPAGAGPLSDGDQVYLSLDPIPRRRSDSA